MYPKVGKDNAMIFSNNFGVAWAQGPQAATPKLFEKIIALSFPTVGYIPYEFLYL